MRKVTENSEMGDKSGNARGVSPHSVCAVLICAALVAVCLWLVRCGSDAATARETEVSTPSVPYSRESLVDADALDRAARSGDTNFLEKARAWARQDIPRLICACDIARNAGRKDELREFALATLDVCRDDKASYAVLMRLARFLDECADYPATREALSRAAPLVGNSIEEEDRAFALLRVDLASEGVTEKRLEELRRYAEKAIMNDNRSIAAQLLEKYGK